MSYRWLGSGAVTAKLGAMSGPALSAYFILREKLEGDPRSVAAGAVQSQEDEDVGEVWLATFGNGGILVYRIRDDLTPPALEPVDLYPPLPESGRFDD